MRGGAGLSARALVIHEPESSPPDYIISLYGHEGLAGSLADIFAELGDARERGPFEVFFDGQARRLLTPYEDVRRTDFGRAGAAAREVLRRVQKILEDRYLVGCPERFAESVDRFAAAFGWQQVCYPRERVGRRPRGGEVSADLRRLIRRHNPVDERLWRWAMGTFAGR